MRRASGVAVCCWLAGCGRVGFDAPPGQWLDPAWRHRRTLTIDHTRVAGELDDFPVLVPIPPGVGTTFTVTDEADNELAYEHDGAAAWVKIPALSSAFDTALHLYYGDPSATDHASPAAVWTNGFVGVYHFGDGATLDVTDSTGGNDGSNTNATATGGTIGGAAAFDTTAAITVPSTGVATGAGAFNTVTFWLYYKLPFNTMPVGFRNSVYGLWFSTDGCEGFNTGTGDNLASRATGLFDHWIHIAAVFFNGMPSASSNALYIDGVPQALSDCSAQGSPTNLGATLYWGGIVGAENYQLNGYLDEGRVAVGARSAAWIQTEHANQSDAATFVRTGPEETL